jgi:precorrin isomerase
MSQFFFYAPLGALAAAYLTAPDFRSAASTTSAQINVVADVSMVDDGLTEGASSGSLGPILAVVTGSSNSALMSAVQGIENIGYPTQ